MVVTEVVELGHRRQDGEVYVCVCGGFCAPKPCGECTQEHMTKFRAKRWGLSKTFNPMAFEPASWAAATIVYI